MISIARVAATINAEHDPGRALELICREAHALFGVDSTLLWEPDGKDLVVVRAVGDMAARLHGFRVPVDDPFSVASRCFRRGSPVLENWLQEGEAGSRRLADLAPARAVLCVPLLHRGDVLGVLGLRDCETPDRFTPFDLEAASLFADMAAVAVANARLQEETERRAREAAALSNIGQIVSSSRNVAGISESFARELRNLVPFDRVSVSFAEENGNCRVLLAAGAGGPENGSGVVHPVAGTAVEWVLERGESRVISDLQREQTFPNDRCYLDLGMRSVALIPLVVGGEVLGTLNLYSATPHAYGPREVRLLQQVAGQIAGVFAADRMVETQRALLARLNSLQRITDAALSTLDLDGLLDSLLERCIEIVGADSGFIWLMNEAGTELAIRGARGMPGESPRECRVAFGEGLSGRVVQDGQPRLVLDVAQEAPQDFVVTPGSGVRSILAVPLKARGNTIGVLRLESRQPNRFGQQHLRLMEVAAERMALAIDNARLMQEARETAAREALVHRIALAVGSSLDLDRVMNTAVEELRAAAGVSRCTIVLADPRGEQGWARWESRAEGVPAMDSEPIPWRDDPTIRAMMLSGAPTVIEDVERESLPEWIAALARRLGVKSVLAVPLLRGGKPMGGLELYQYGRTRSWTKREVDLVQAVAAQLSVAVENAQLYGQTDEQLRARVRELGSLLRLGRAVSEQLSLDLVMQRAAEEGVEALGVDWCAIATVDWDSGLLALRAVCAGGGDAGAKKGREFSLVDCPPCYRTLIRRKPTVLTERGSEPSVEERALLRDIGMGCCILVPLAVGDSTIGLAFFGRKPGGPGFSEDNVVLAQAMAGQVAVAMDNARLFQEVQTQKARTEAILYSMSEGMYAIDLEGRITAVNPALEMLVGRRVEDLVGRKCRDVLSPVDDAGLPLCEESCPEVVALREGRATEPAVVHLQTAWGVRLPCMVSAAPIRDESGRIAGAVSVVRDVSREWQVDKLRSNIISVVSHEFRTPLTSIIGFSELLLTTTRSKEEQRACLEYILQEGLRLERLVGDLLDVSRLDSGRMVLNLETVDPVMVVERCVDAIAVHPGGDRVVAEIEEGLPCIEADLERLAQILDNLLTNAIKYSPEGAPVLVRARSAVAHGDEELRFGEEGGERWVVFTVEDRGIGIPADQIPDIFVPFHRVEGQFTRRVRGTGLGLSIVKSLVELHQGKLWVESSVGVGSRFHVGLRAVSHQPSAVGG